MPWPTKITQSDADNLRLKTNQTVTIKFLDDEPDLYYTHFVNNKSVLCNEPCNHCANKLKRSEKGSIRILDRSDNREKRLSGTAALFFSIKHTLDMCGGNRNLFFNIQAVGEQKDRRYYVIPAQDGVPVKSASKDIDEEETPF